MTAATEWVPVAEAKPELHNQVLIAFVGGAGFVADVACYLGPLPGGGDRWILADISLDSSQISHWAEIVAPGDEVKVA